MIVLIEKRLPNWLASFFFHLLTRVPPILASVGNINGTKGTEVLNFFFSFTVCDNKYVYLAPCSVYVKTCVILTQMIRSTKYDSLFR